MDTQPEFPEKRLSAPPQRLEEADFSLWIEDVGRVDIEVKGGRYCVGEWLTEGPGGDGCGVDDQAA